MTKTLTFIFIFLFGQALGANLEQLSSSIYNFHDYAASIDALEGVRDYHFNRSIGSGFFGEVFEAHLLSDPAQHVAIKIIKEYRFYSPNEKFPSCARYDRQNALADEIPSIFKTLKNIRMDVETEETDYKYTFGFCVSIMPLAEGDYKEPMFAAAATDRAANTAAVFQVLREVVDGIFALNGKHLMHQDMKAENVLKARGPGGAVVPRISDFDLLFDLDNPPVPAEPERLNNFVTNEEVKLNETIEGVLQANAAFIDAKDSRFAGLRTEVKNHFTELRRIYCDSLPPTKHIDLSFDEDYQDVFVDDILII